MQLLAKLMRVARGTVVGRKEARQRKEIERRYKHVLPVFFFFGVKQVYMLMSLHVVVLGKIWGIYQDHPVWLSNRKSIYKYIYIYIV